MLREVVECAYAERAIKGGLSSLDAPEQIAPRLHAPRLAEHDGDATQRPGRVRTERLGQRSQAEASLPSFGPVFCNVFRKYSDARQRAQQPVKRPRVRARLCSQLRAGLRALSPQIGDAEAGGPGAGLWNP